MVIKNPLFCFRKAESKDSFLCGGRVDGEGGILKEWKAFTFEDAMRALEDMRRFEGWKVGVLSYEFGLGLEGVKSRHEEDGDEVGTSLLHFVAPERVGWGRITNDGVRSTDKEQDDFFAASEPKPQLSRDDYVKAIEEIHDLLRAGETYQVNFSYPFYGTYDGDVWTFFKRLYDINPSPHACFLDFTSLHGGVAVASNSPERLLSGHRGDDGRLWLETKPIKGTVGVEYRMKNEEYRMGAREQENLYTEKHAAELDMIVDLARNDLGKVCEAGTVHVPDHRSVEVYSHVAHTVSTVRGQLREGLDWMDALLAVFPGGSVTGAPKKRTMEIIDRLEMARRGIYTGSAGWISPDGEFDFNILIRTVAFKQGRYVFNSGGGIVADSVAESEYQETLHKAAAIRAALA